MNKCNVFYALVMLVFISSINAADGPDTTFYFPRVKNRVKELSTSFKTPRREGEAMVENVKLAVIAAEQRNELIEQNNEIIKLLRLLVENNKTSSKKTK